MTTVKTIAPRYSWQKHAGREGKSFVEHSNRDLHFDNLRAQLARLQARLEALERAARHALPCPTCGGNGTITVAITPLQEIAAAEAAQIRFQPLPGETQLVQCPTCGGHGDLVGELPSLEVEA